MNGLERQVENVIDETIELVDTINAVIQNITGQSLPQFLDEVRLKVTAAPNILQDGSLV